MWERKGTLSGNACLDVLVLCSGYEYSECILCHPLIFSDSLSVQFKRDVRRGVSHQFLSRLHVCPR